MVSLFGDETVHSFLLYSRSVTQTHTHPPSTLTLFEKRKRCAFDLRKSGVLQLCHLSDRKQTQPYAGGQRIDGPEQQTHSKDWKTQAGRSLR